ncbi:MAG: DHH family phosphoesterase [bacterium]|nr:DHH family phosphoesterase [bacterium]
MISESVLFAKAHDAVLKANRILLIGDFDPDGDSIGAVTAFYDWVKTLKKEVDVFCPRPLPKNLLSLDHVYDISNDPATLEFPHDLIITFDAGDVARASLKDTTRIPKGYQLIVVDHHATNTKFGDLNLVFTEACATCEVVYRFFIANKIAITPAIASSLLAGLAYDTTFFTNAATTARGMEIAGALLSAGARLSDVTKSLAKNKSIPALKLWGLALSRLTKNEKLDFVWTYFLQADLEGIPGAEEAIAGMSNFLAGISGSSDAVLVLHEQKNGMVRGSMRSMNRDISTLAKALGGGGHKKAAAFSIPGKLELKDGKICIIQPTTA